MLHTRSDFMEGILSIKTTHCTSIIYILTNSFSYSLSLFTWQKIYHMGKQEFNSPEFNLSLARDERKPYII